MKRNQIIGFIVIAVMIAIIVNSLYSGETDEAYIERLTEHRTKKDIDFQTGDDSPFADDYSRFTGLKYYPPNPAYNVNARFDPIEDKKIRTLPTSDGKTKQYLEYGYAKFDLDGIQNKLTILEMVGGGFDGNLFLAFGDATSAIETYGAGRYLEVEHTGGKAVELDFNYAYNPYCAYSDDFSCPFPPKENLLAIAIKAGEKNYD